MQQRHVEHRPHAEALRVRRQLSRPVDQAAEAQRVPVLLDDALGLAGGAAGVDDAQQVVLINVDLRVLRRVTLDQLFVVQHVRGGAVDADAVLHLRDLIPDRADAVGELVLHADRHRARILDDENQFIGLQAPVQGHVDEAGLGGAGNLDVFRQVAGQHGHSVALSQAQVQERVAEPVDPGVELVVGPLFTALPGYQGELAAVDAGVPLQYVTPGLNPQGIPLCHGTLHRSVKRSRTPPSDLTPPSKAV